MSNEKTETKEIANVQMGFGSLESFELMQRAAKLLSSSTLVPMIYRAQIVKKGSGNNGWTETVEENPNALPNCVIALNMSARMGADPLMIMQNLYVIEGRPSWSSQFVISAINTCGRYSPLRFELSEAGEPEEISYAASEGYGKDRKTVTKKLKIRHQSCIAWAIERETGQRLESPKITIQMAIDEGWMTKNASKWQTIPELMLRYRAAAFFGRLYAPEILMGLSTIDEAFDIIDVNEHGEPETITRSTGEVEPIQMPKAKAKSTKVKTEAEAVAIDEPQKAEVAQGSIIDADAATWGERNLISNKLEVLQKPVSLAMEDLGIECDFENITKADAHVMLEYIEALEKQGNLI